MNRFPRITVAAVLMAMVGSMAVAWNDPGGSGGGVKTERTAEELRQLLEDYQELRSARQQTAALLEVHAAIAHFGDINKALSAGYVQSGECMAGPEGAQGIHFANEALMAEPSLDPLRPQLVMYEPQADGSLRLIGVEYLVFQRAWYEAGNSEPPSLFGEAFYLNETLLDEPFYALHVWIGQFNPSGLFADWNPLVSCLG